MLPKNRRIPRALWPALKKKRPQVSRSNTLTLRVVPNGDGARFSFVVSTKVAGKATRRNILRRRGYHIVRDILADVKPWAYIFFFMKGASKRSFSELKSEIESLMLQYKHYRK